MNQNGKESPKILGEQEYERAIYLINSGHRKESIPLFYKSANLNYPPSFLWLHFLTEDKNEEQNWLLKAETNFTWYQSKAQDGKPDSLYNLGCCFEFGIGTEGNYNKAIELYNKASEQGFASAQFKLGSCHTNRVPEDSDRLIQLCSKAAEQGLAEAQYRLGECYEYGEGVPKNIKRAVELYTKAAQQEFADAQCNLGLCYLKGRGVSKDFKKAIELYNKAAQQGINSARYLNLSSEDIDVQEIADVLKVDRATEFLYIGDCNIGSLGAQAIADVLKVNTTLTSLNLTKNNIGNSGAQAIVDVLKIDRFTVKGIVSIQTLINVTETELANTSIENIEKALKITKVLLVLDISCRILYCLFNLKDNGIGDEGISAIAEMLKVNNSLQELHIASNRFADISKLGDALKYNRTLTMLSIEESKSNVKELEKVLQSNICLLHIRRQFENPFRSFTIHELLTRNEEIQTTLSKRIFKCKNAHLSLLDYKILERVNAAVIFENVWKLHQAKQTGKTYEEYLREYWELISLNGFSKHFLFILGVCKLNQIPPSRSHLLGIPKEILNYIGSFLNPKDFSIVKNLKDKKSNF